MIRSLVIGEEYESCEASPIFDAYLSGFAALQHLTLVGHVHNVLTPLLPLPTFRTLSLKIIDRGIPSLVLIASALSKSFTRLRTVRIPPRPVRRRLVDRFEEEDDLEEVCAARGIQLIYLSEEENLVGSWEDMAQLGEVPCHSLFFASVCSPPLSRRELGEQLLSSAGGA